MSWFLMALGRYHVLYLLKWLRNMSWFLMALGRYHVLHLLKWLRNMSWFLMAMGGFHDKKTGRPGWVTRRLAGQAV